MTGGGGRCRIVAGRSGAGQKLRPPPATANVTDKEARMDLMEITEKERLSREDAAARLGAGGQPRESGREKPRLGRRASTP